MNLNPLLMKLKDITGLEVAPDKYLGNNENYITFNYADERPAMYADNEPVCDVANMMVHVFLNQNENYLSYKSKVKSYLENIGAYGVSVNTLYEYDTNKRHMIFEFDYSEERN